eukprot:3849177-Prymnesium_polylepis.1
MSIAGPSNAAGHSVARAAGTRAEASGALDSAPSTPSRSEQAADRLRRWTRLRRDGEREAGCRDDGHRR